MMYAHKGVWSFSLFLSCSFPCTHVRSALLFSSFMCSFKKISFSFSRTKERERRRRGRRKRREGNGNCVYQWCVFSPSLLPRLLTLTRIHAHIHPTHTASPSLFFSLLEFIYTDQLTPLSSSSKQQEMKQEGVCPSASSFSYHGNYITLSHTIHIVLFSLLSLLSLSLSLSCYGN